MNLTVEQRKKAKENVQEIANWITPLFSQVKRPIEYIISNNSFKYEFYLCDTSCILYVGSARYIIAITYESKTNEFLINQSSEYIIKLLQEWPNIKRYILEELNNQKATIDLLENFTV